MKEVTLRDMFFDHTGRQIDKWEHYFPIYEKHFARFRGTYVRVLEIGVDHGGSLQLWKRYFGRYAEIIGVDISPDTMFTEVQITTHCYDQVDPNIAKLGPFDIVIDDGSHVLQHQSASFMNLWGHTRFVYLIEDCHGAYPSLVSYPEALLYHYPQVVVCEKARRSIRGTPSRRLRPDESEARRYYAR
jgi:SAM-dependent methyltransferase